MHHRRLSIVIAGIFGIAAVFGGLFLWHRHKQGAALAESVPRRPDFTNRAPALATRIASCEQRIRSRRSEIDALGELSRLYHANGFLFEAAQCYIALEHFDPDEARWPYRHAMILSGYGDNEPAIDRLRYVVDLVPEYLPAQIRLGETWLKIGAIVQANEAYLRVWQAHPDEPYALLGLARCDIDREQWENARIKLERLVNMTNYALGYDLIVSVYERLGDYNRAAEIRGQMRAWGAFRDMVDPWMEELLEDSYDAYQLSLAAGTAERRPDISLAVRRMERAVQLAPDTAMLHFQLAMLYLKRPEYTKAREQLEYCTRLAPNFADGWAHLSGVLAIVGDRSASQRILDQGLRSCPDSPGLHLMNATRLKNSGHLGEAISEFRRSIELRPTEADAYIELGVTLMSAGRTEEGIQTLTSALEAEPLHPFVLYTLALHAIRHGDEFSARRWLEQVQQQPRVKPDDRSQLRREFATAFGEAPF